MRSLPLGVLRRILLAVAVTTGLTEALSAQAAAPKRTPTCIEGLRVYPMPTDVPVPHDTIKPDLSAAGGEVSGMRQVTNIEDFVKQILTGAAALGATGYINYQKSGDASTESRQLVGRTLPVFVAGDSARALAVCRARPKQPPTDPALRTELLAMVKADQALRLRIDSLMGDNSKSEELMRVLHQTEAVDSANTARVKSVLAELGWPGKSKVGADGAQAMWLLVQHADADPVFQRTALSHLERAVGAGEASGRDLAYLTDRVLLAAGEPQRFGTQMTRDGGRLVVRPIADSGGVDERRRKVGLGPLADAVKGAGRP